MNKIFFLPLILIFINSCTCEECDCEENDGVDILVDSDNFEIDGNTYMVDTVLTFEGDGIESVENPSPSDEYKSLYSSLTGNVLMADPNALAETCPDRPRTMAELSGGLQKYFYKFTDDSNVNLDVFGYGGGQLGKKELLLIVDWVQFKEQECSQGNRKRYGVGARLFLHITKKKRGVSLQLPTLAANVELDRAEVTYTISTIGITGDQVLDALPTGATFDVENYAKVINAVDRIITLARDNTDGVIIDPQLLPEVSSNN
jgi:hypothetical protein